MLENPEFYKTLGYIGIGGGYLFLIVAVLGCYNDGKSLWKREMDRRLKESDEYKSLVFTMDEIKKSRLEEDKRRN